MNMKIGLLIPCTSRNRNWVISLIITSNPLLQPGLKVISIHFILDMIRAIGFFLISGNKITRELLRKCIAILK